MAEQLNQFDFDAWRERFGQQLQTLPADAATAWSDLLRDGCDENVLLLGIAMACDFPSGPGYQLVSELRSGAKSYVRDCKTLHSKLMETRKAVENAAALSKRVELLEALDFEISELAKTIESSESITSARTFNPSFFLVALAAYIELITGRPRYRSISLLLARAYAAFGLRSVVTPGEEAIRKVVDRFKDRNPEWVTPEGKFDYAGLKSALLMPTVLFIGVYTVLKHQADSRG